MRLGGGRAYSAKGEQCLPGNHGNQASANQPAPFTERVQWNTYYNPYLPIRGWDEWEQYQQISQAMNSNDPQRSAKQSKADLRDAITYQPLQTRRPPHTSLPACDSTADLLALSRG